MSRASVLLLLVTQLRLPLLLDGGSSRKGLNLWPLPTDQYQQHFELILKKPNRATRRNSTMHCGYYTQQTILYLEMASRKLLILLRLYSISGPRGSFRSPKTVVLSSFYKVHVPNTRLSYFKTFSGLCYKDGYFHFKSQKLSLREGKRFPSR